VFALGARGEREGGGSGTALTQAASIILPLLFAFSFAYRGDLAAGIVPIASMLGILSLAAGFIGRARKAPWLGVVAAASSVAVLGVWLTGNQAQEVSHWLLVAATVLLAAVAHVFLELEHARPRGAARAVSLAAAVGTSGGALLLVCAAINGSAASPWPMVVGLAVLTAFVVRHAGFARREPLHIAGALGLGLGLLGVHLAHGRDPGFATPSTYLALLVGAAAAFQVAAWLPRSEAARRWGHHASALLASILAFDALANPGSYGVVGLAFTTSALAAIALVSATALGEGLWVFVTTGVLALVQAGWALEVLDRYPPDTARTALALSALTVVALTAWPLCVRRLREQPWAWRAAALAGPAFYPALQAAWVSAFGDFGPGLIPLGLAAVAFTSAWTLSRGSSDRQRAVAWFGATGIAFVTLAIGLSFTNEWLTIGWALEGLALVVLWRRKMHVGLKYAGLAHLAAATVRLVANPAVLDYHLHASTPVLNWLALAYGVPLLALIAAWRLLSPVETDHTLAWEPFATEDRGRPIAFGAIACAAAAAMVMFAWLNLTIIDGFTSGERLELALVHMPARDLVISIAWAAYAIGLLVIGMARASAALRWTSLGLILATVAKVFLYDLGHLRDLYRVASLVGLAASLIVISIAYQRFVFGPPARRAEPTRA